MASTPVTLDELMKNRYSSFFMYDGSIASPKPGYFVIQMPIPKGFGDFEQNELGHVKRDLNVLKEHGYETEYLGSKRAGSKFVVKFTVEKTDSTKAQYDMTGHFRDLPKAEGPKKPGLTQGAQKRVDKLKEIKAQIVKTARTVTSVIQIGHLEGWFMRQATWCRANGFPRTADAISDFVGVVDMPSPMGIKGDLAKIIVAINADIQAANKIFGTKSVTKAVSVADIKGKLDQMMSDVASLEATLNGAGNNFKPYLAESMAIWKKWKTTVRKWLAMKPYPFAWQGAWMGLESNLSFIASAESKPKAEMAINQLKTSIQTLKGATKAAMPRNVQIWAIAEESKRILADIGPTMNLVGFHNKWNAFIKRQIKKADSLGDADSNEVAGMLETILRSSDRGVLGSTAAQLKMKLSSWK